MTLIETIKKLIGNNNENKRAFMDEMARRKIQRVLDAREKNSNERELERFMEEDRQRRIKIALDGYRKKHKKEYWKSNSINSGWDILKDDRPILKTKTIFKMKGNNLRGGMR